MKDECHNYKGSYDLVKVSCPFCNPDKLGKKEIVKAVQNGELTMNEEGAKLLGLPSNKKSTYIYD